MYLLNLHFPGKSYELSSLPESLTNSSCKQNTKHVSSASLNGILSIRNLSALLHWCFQVSYIKFINNHYIKKKKTVSYKNIITKPLNPKLFAQHQFYIRLAIPKKDALQNCCQFSARLHSSCTTQHRLLNLFVKSQKASLLPEKAFSCSLMCPAFDRSSHCSQRIQHKQIQTNKIHNSQVTANLPNRLKCQLLPTQSLQAH